jgi:hypothetical protein
MAGEFMRFSRATVAGGWSRPRSGLSRIPVMAACPGGVLAGAGGGQRRNGPIPAGQLWMEAAQPSWSVWREIAWLGRSAYCCRRVLSASQRVMFWAAGCGLARGALEPWRSSQG